MGNGRLNYREPPKFINYVQSHYKDKRGMFLCGCGQVFESRVSHISSGNTKSCGCLKRNRGGISNHPEYNLWKDMKRRCLNPKHKGYKNYGGRGITICEDWLNSFEVFISDMGSRPSRFHSVDRINNNKGYSKDNCRWALPIVQNRNTRYNKFYEYEGEIHCIAEWSEILGISYGILRDRLVDKQLSPKQAFKKQITWERQD